MQRQSREKTSKGQNQVIQKNKKHQEELKLKTEGNK